MIHTKIHRLLERLESPEVVRNQQTCDALTLLKPLLKSMPHYVLTQELLAVLTTDVVDSTVEALMDASVARLPHETCLIEMRQQTKQGGWGNSFLVAQQRGESPAWDCAFIFLHDDGLVQSTHKPVTLSIKPYNALTDGALERRTKYVYETSMAMGTIGISMASALGVLLTLTHTRGVITEKVTAQHLEKLNKARARSGKTQVLPYTLYKIGHVYTPSGEKTTYAPGCKRRPHLRAGHVRKQKYGSGRQLEKLIFIEPILVNCESADEVQHKPKVMSW